MLRCFIVLLISGTTASPRSPEVRRGTERGGEGMNENWRRIWENLSTSFSVIIK